MVTSYLIDGKSISSNSQYRGTALRAISRFGESWLSYCTWSSIIHCCWSLTCRPMREYPFLVFISNWSDTHITCIRQGLTHFKIIPFKVVFRRWYKYRISNLMWTQHWIMMVDDIAHLVFNQYSTSKQLHVPAGIVPVLHFKVLNLRVLKYFYIN